MHTVPYSDEAIQRAVDVIRRGGVVAHATETCYGLACDLSNPAAVERLFAVKQRPARQPVSALFASVEDAKRHVIWNDRAREYEAHLPGPLTLILPLPPDSPLRATPAGTETIGVRVSSHPHAQALVRAAGRPLSTTSANLHGQPSPYSAEEIQRQFAAADVKPDLILDDGPLPPTPSSTVIDLTGGAGVLRQGGIRL